MYLKINKICIFKFLEKFKLYLEKLYLNFAVRLHFSNNCDFRKHFAYILVGFKKFNLPGDGTDRKAIKADFHLLVNYQILPKLSDKSETRNSLLYVIF